MKAWIAADRRLVVEQLPGHDHALNPVEQV
jgi:hypothetical protein